MTCPPTPAGRRRESGLPFRLGISRPSACAGLGLLLGFVLYPEHVPAVEGKTPAQVVVAHLMDHGMLTVPAGPQTIRWLPPLNVTDAEVDEALAIMRHTLETLAPHS